MVNNSSKNLWSYPTFHLALFALLSLWLYQQQQPTVIVSPQLAGKKLQCVSYAPYYGKNQSPLVLGTTVSHAQIDADLKKLSEVTQCVRTYSVGQGMDYVPEAAAKVGLKVYLGAWIGWVDKDNTLEVNLAAQQANAFPDTVKALIIGNEVFLRQEQTEAAMQRYISLARKQTKTPITYADVWEFWNKHRAMEPYVDFITVHILPYWEDNPVDIDHAVSHANNVMTQLGANFKKPILIGETGWPSMGRQRVESSPSLINQARYVREFLQTAADKNWQYNIIEAIDQPWKRSLEGTVGGYWGLYSTDLTQKFSLSEPISARNDGLKPVYYACIGAIFFLVLSLLKNESRPSMLLAWFFLGASSGLVALLQLDYLIAACRDTTEWIMLGGVAMIGWLVLFAQPWALNKKPLHQASVKSAQKLTNLGLVCLIVASIVSSSLISIDGRYRDFPNLLLALPAIVLAFHLFLNAYQHILNTSFNQTLCLIASVLALICVWVEPTNHAALLWLAITVLMAFAHWPKRIS